MIDAPFLLELLENSVGVHHLANKTALDKRSLRLTNSQQTTVPATAAAE